MPQPFDRSTWNLVGILVLHRPSGLYAFGQGHLKVKVNLSDLDLFFFCLLCGKYLADCHQIWYSEGFWDEGSSHDLEYVLGQRSRSQWPCPFFWFSCCVKVSDRLLQNSVWWRFNIEQYILWSWILTRSKVKVTMTSTAFSIACCAKTNGPIGTNFGMVKVSNGIIHPMALAMS